MSPVEILRDPPPSLIDAVFDALPSEVEIDYRDGEAIRRMLLVIAEMVSSPR